MKKNKLKLILGVVFGLMVFGIYQTSTEVMGDGVSVSAANEDLDTETRDAREVHELINNFLVRYIDKNPQMTRGEFREGIVPLVDEAILGNVAPGYEELYEMYGDQIVISEEEYNAEQDYTTVKILERDIYVDYETLNTRTVSAVATVVHTLHSGEDSYDIHYFEVKDNRSEWIIIEHNSMELRSR